MAKAICAKSGIEFQIEHFPYYFRKGEFCHPVFLLDTKTLLGMVSKWAEREFTETDTKLYFLSLLNSTELVDWRTYARPDLRICEANMEALVRMVSWIHSIKHPGLSMPKFAVTKDTADLSNFRYWLEAWQNARGEFENGYREYTQQQKIIRREHALEKMIKTPGRQPESYASHLAEWAALVSNFPTFNTIVDGKHIRIDEYWKDIIRKCGIPNYQMWKLNKDDLQELLEHLTDNIDHGSIYAAALMKLVRNAIDRHSNFLGLDLTAGQTGFTIISNDASVEQANIAALIAAAPTTEPMERDYPSKVAYLRAKLKWDMAARYSSSSPDSSSDASSITNSVE